MEGRKLRIIHVIPDHPAPSSFIFAKRQVEDLKEMGHLNEVFYFNTRFSLTGFIRQFKQFKQIVKDFKPDLIHAHYGTITAFFASWLHAVPLIISFQGSDINHTSDVHWIREKAGKFFSKIAAKRSTQIICVSPKLHRNLPFGKDKSTVIPSGINTKLFRKLDKLSCKRQLGLDEDTQFVFFNANNPIVKRLDVAMESVALLTDLKVQLLSLKGDVLPDEIPIYLNASALTLLCSDSEGSPLVIKEAMACGLPIVSVDVGDVKDRIEGVENCFIVPQNAMDIAAKIRYIIEHKIEETNGLEALVKEGIDSVSTARKVEKVYFNALRTNDNNGEM